MRENKTEALALLTVIAAAASYVVVFAVAIAEGAAGETALVKGSIAMLGIGLLGGICAAATGVAERSPEEVREKGQLVDHRIEASSGELEGANE